MIQAILLSLFVLFSNYQGVKPNPATGKKEVHLFNQTDEIAFGSSVYQEMISGEGGKATDVDADRVVRIGKRVAAASDRPDLPYEFTILNNPMENAWCLPGGKIAINRGMVEGLKTDGQLAFILAHEIAHANARHTAHSIENDLFHGGAFPIFSQVHALFSFKESQAAEAQADQLGLTYLKRAGYQPSEAIAVYKIFQGLDGANDKPSFFATHPSATERLHLGEATINNLMNT